MKENLKPMEQEIKMDESKLEEALRNFMKLPKDQKVVEYNRMGIRAQELKRDSMLATDPDKKRQIDEDLAMYEAIIKKIDESDVFEATFEAKSTQNLKE